MKHLKSILVLVVLLALLGTSQPAFVRADELPVATDAGQANVIDADALAAAAVSPMRASRDYPFNVVIPVTTYAYTPDWFEMSPGKYVTAELTFSDGHWVYMTVVDRDTLQPLGSEVAFYGTGTQLLWSNTTGVTHYVKIRFGASALVSVPAKGILHFYPF